MAQKLYNNNIDELVEGSDTLSLNHLYHELPIHKSAPNHKDIKRQGVKDPLKIHFQMEQDAANQRREKQRQFVKKRMEKLLRKHKHLDLSPKTSQALQKSLKASSFVDSNGMKKRRNSNGSIKSSFLPKQSDQISPMVHESLPQTRLLVSKHGVSAFQQNAQTSSFQTPGKRGSNLFNQI